MCFAVMIDFFIIIVINLSIFIPNRLNKEKPKPTLYLIFALRGHTKLITKHGP